LELFSILQARGIMRQFLVPHTPPQDGAVERMNKNILNRARVMMRTTKVINSFET